MHDPALPTPPPATPAACAQCLRPLTGAWGRSWVEVDLSALQRNARRVAAALPAGGRLIASVKKEAYGHGLLAVAGALAGRPEIGGFGVATIEEGLALRHAGYSLSVLCFSVLEGEALAAAIAHDLTLTVTDLAEARAADALAARLDRRARVHLKIDTGLGRTGRLPMDVMGEINAIRALSLGVPPSGGIPAKAGTPELHLELTGIYSHLADAWADRAGARAQGARLDEFRRDAGLERLPCHWGGSDAVAVSGLLRPGDGLRSGIALYGSHPGFPGLEPVMTFKTRVIHRRRVEAGAAISYGGTFVTTRATELALVGAGYGNGLPRALSGRGACVLLRGRRCPILGRVCMDLAIVDVTEIPEVGVGEEAVIFGRQGEAALPAAEQAERAGTISYELFCLAGQLNPRIYFNQIS